jgi:endonuclease/exonuclease/phosphatase family metal-dependent hydrolase
MNAHSTNTRLTLAIVIALLTFLGGNPGHGDDSASAPVRLRVLTYNIHHGEGVDGKLDLERIAGVIRAARPDLVALQEVDRRARRTSGVDQSAELARLTGMHVAFGRNVPLEGGEYGNAVLSRRPIKSQKNHSLPSLGPGEKRGLLAVELELAVGKPLLFLSTHLDHRPAEHERELSAEAINTIVANQPTKLAILAGDLNAIPTGSTLAIFKKSWMMANAEPLATSPAVSPRRQIDYVLLRPKGTWKVVDVQVLDESIASDHRPLLAILELAP